MKSCEPNLACAPCLAPRPYPSYLKLSFVTDDVQGCPLWPEKARIGWSSVGVGGAEEVSASQPRAHVGPQSTAAATGSDTAPLACKGHPK